MGISLADQTMDFLLSCGVGFVLGAFYEIFRFYRIVLRPGKVLVFFQDLFYWTACGVATFLFIFWANAGEIRGFLIVGELLGAVIYYCTLGWLMLQNARLIARILHRISMFLKKYVWTPLTKPFRLLWRAIRKGTGKMGQTTKKVGISAKNRLKKHRALLYNLFNGIRLSGSKKTGKGE